MPRRRRTRGFTLLELMLVVAIVAVLAAIALPSYRSYVIRANRNQAQQVMQDIANREEQYRLDARSYTATIGSGGLNYTIPADTSSSVAANYTISVSVVAVGATGADCNGTAAQLVGPAYKVSAAAQGSQASDGDLCLDSNSNKTPTAKWQR